MTSCDTRRATRIPVLTVIAATLLLLVVPAPVASAQAVRFGVVMEQARRSLEPTWSEDPQQFERAYCVSNWTVAVDRVTRNPLQQDSVFRVFAVTPADLRSATPNSADFECPPGVPELHTHPPATCASDNVAWCIAGGPDAFSCQPSRGDLVKLVRRGDPFGVIQCDKRAFRFFFPAEYAPPAQSAATSTSPSVTTRASRRGNVTEQGVP
ncbi:MAG TPA: hypothetical protein VJ672_16755 [Gemmatimonadaceae bacterium]|nr:hypothetical protein [Gemmatimonadaceae bacterium]